MKFLLYTILLTVLVNTVQAQACISGDCQNGFGIQTYANGDKYVGEFLNGTRTGQGVLESTNQEKYIGSWKANLRHGEGRVYRTGKLVKSGNWKNNQLPKLSYIQNGCLTGNCTNGVGIYLYKDGSKVFAKFESGEVSGYAISYYADGSKYIGNIKNQKKHSSGIYFNANGTIQEGVWNEGKFVVATEHTGKKGCINGNCINGKGITKYDDYSLYEGHFFNEQADGSGIHHFSNGNIYVGQWENNQFSGKGTMYYNSGAVLKGIWSNGYFDKMLEEKTVNKTGYDIDESKMGKTWVLLVGVSNYTDLNNLKYTDDDAFKLHSFFKSPAGGAIADEQITLLIDESATQDVILKNLKFIAKNAKENDQILFYFSGHGFKGSFVPHDYRKGGDVLVKHDELIAILENSKAKSKVVIADACHAGSMNTKGDFCNNVLDIYYNAFRKSLGGTVLLLSSKADELSIESNGLKQGLFSHFLLRGLKGKANKNGDSIVTVSELHQYVYNNVRYVTDGYQTPVIHGEFDVNMPISVVTD